MTEAQATELLTRVADLQAKLSGSVVSFQMGSEMRLGLQWAVIFLAGILFFSVIRALRRS